MPEPTLTFQLHNRTRQVLESPLPDRQKVRPGETVGPIDGRWEQDPKVVRSLASGQFTVVNRILGEKPAEVVEADQPTPPPKVKKKSAKKRTAKSQKRG